MADSSCTRDDRRERIVAECNAVRQALQDLLSEYMNNVSPRLSGPRRQRLRKILVRDQVAPGREMPWESRSGEIQEPLWESSALISQNVLAEGTRLVEEVSEYFGYLLEWFLGRFSGLPLIEESLLLVKVDGGWKYLRIYWSPLQSNVKIKGSYGWLIFTPKRH